jgi:translation initiation factor eIF-2B subunit delta
LIKIDHPDQHEIDAAIRIIAADNRSGAAEILSRVERVFTPLASSTLQTNDSLESARDSVLNICVALVQAQPDMSPILRVASEALAASRAHEEPHDVFKFAGQSALSFIQHSINAARDVAVNAARTIINGDIILTHSRSSSVFAALNQAKLDGKVFEIITTESRPGMEGRRLAADLYDRGIKVMLITDAAAALALDRATKIFVGADTVTPENLVNKMGTRMIALAAREKGLPIYALCDSSKFINLTDTSVSQKQGSTAEVWEAAPEGVEISNRYFEPTPLNLITGFVTEEGVLTADAAASIAQAATIETILVESLRS